MHLFTKSSLLLILLSSFMYAQSTFKIASIYAHTGKAKNGNSFSKQAVRISVDIINNNGGVLGKQIELIELDNKSTALGSQEAALKAIMLGAKAVIGSSWSSHSLAMAPILQMNKIPMISNYSTDDNLTKIGDYIFRVCFSNDFQAKTINTFIEKTLKLKTLVVFENISSPNSVSLSKSLIMNLKNKDMKLLKKLKYKNNASNFKDSLEIVKSLNPDIIILTGKGFDSALIIDQAKDMGIKKIFMGSDGWSELMFKYSKNVEGNYFVSHWHKDASNRISKKTYEKLSHLGAGAFLSYDALGVLINAVKKANSFESPDIRSALAQTKDFHGSTGLISFDKIGNPVNKSSIIVKFENNEVKYVQTIRDYK